MINNRQNGRRRGRGGGGPRPNNAPSPGNRQDNRQRGNAAQLHEKYKALARDTQLAGDRVQTEYYLQFADHYYRILNENRARFEEQRPRRDDFMVDDEDDGDESAYGADGEDGDERPQQQQQRPEREFRPRREFREEPRGEREPREAGGDRDYREPRGEREAREPRVARERNAGDAPQQRFDRGDESERAESRPRPRRRERQPERDAEPAVVAQPVEPNGEGRLSLDVLPPAIAAEVGDAKPRRTRARRPRPEGETEIAPAA